MPRVSNALIDTSNIPLSCTVALTQGGVVDGGFRPYMELGPDARCFFAEGKVDQLELGWYLYIYLYIYMYMINVCKYITDCRQAWLIIFTVDLLLLCECKWFADVFYAKTFVCHEQLYCCRIIGLILGGPWCNICKVDKHRSQSFFRPVQQKASPWCLWEPLRTPLIWSIPSKSYNHSFPFWERTKLLELLLCEVY